MFIFNQCIYLISVVYSMHKILKLNYSKKLAAIIFSVLLLPVIYFIQDYTSLVFLFETLLIISIFFGEKIKTIILAFLGTSCVFTIIQLLFGVIAGFFNLDVFYINLISAVLYLLLVAIFDKTAFIDRLKYNKSAQIFAFNGLINLLLITIIFVIIDIYFNAIPSLGMAVLLGLIAIFTISSQVVTYQYVKNINQLNQNKLLYDIQKHSYENSMIKYKERLSFLHDVKAYIASLNGLLNNDDVPGAIKLINEISGELKKNKIVYSNNQYINLIINDFEAKFKENSINFKYSEVIFGEINLESMDIISLFYNIISNAVEAAKNSKDKTILINVKLNENILYIDILNSVHSDFDIKTIKMGETTKIDKDIHGIGLLNLNKIIKKYSGNMEWSEENGMFKLEIFLLS